MPHYKKFKKITSKADREDIKDDLINGLMQGSGRFAQHNTDSTMAPLFNVVGDEIDIALDEFVDKIIACYNANQSKENHTYNEVDE